MDLFTNACFRDNMKMRSTILIVVFLLTSISTHAADICDDFYATACAGQPSADPSGKILSKEEVAERLRVAREQIHPRIPQLVKEVMAEDPSFAKAMEKLIPCKSDCENFRINAVASVVEKGTVGNFDPKRDLSLIKIYIISGEPAYMKLADRVDREFREILTPKDKRQDIENKLLKHLVEISKERINRLQLSDDIRGKILKKLDKVSAKAGSCGMLQNDELYPTQTMNYLPGKSLITICEGALLKYDSRIAIAAMILHEIGHSAVDPCAMASGKEPVINYVINQPRDPQYPVKGLIECLRGADAAGAAYNSECKRDQIGETISDWFRGEVLPAFIKEEYEKMSLEERKAAYINAAQRFCEQGPVVPGYPDYKIRVNALLAAQPAIREQIGCKGRPSAHKYCDAPADGESNDKEYKIEATK